MRERKGYEEQNTTEASVENLTRCLEVIARELRKERIPVTDECRIEMRAFEALYGEKAISLDEARIEKLEKGWSRGDRREEAERLRLHTRGEQLEILKTAVLHKNLGSQFIVVRSSRHDDIKNKVDNLLLDRNTGSLVCAFDEVASASGYDFEKKRTRVLERNASERGARLKYCLGLERKGDVMGLQLKGEDHVPVFYLALSEDYIKKGIQDLLPDMTRQSETEKKLFGYFMAALKLQLSELELRQERLAPELRLKLSGFGQFLRDLRQ